MPGKRKLGLPENRPIPAGVPLGGIGCGSFEMGIDGRIRNVTINNNRTAEERIREIPGTFLAVRALVRGKVATRVLQSTSGLPWEDAGIEPPLTKPEKLSWRGLYPVSTYSLSDSGFPLNVSWRAMAPIVPFDLEASTLPAVLFFVSIENPTDQYVDASILFNWENICGCSQLHWPEERGHISKVQLAMDQGEGGAPSRVTGGLEFGRFTEFEGNAHGNYCLAPKLGGAAKYSVMAWNASSGADLEELWNRFTYEGDLQDSVSMDPKGMQGALCGTANIEPRSRQTFTFALGWFCPQYVANGSDMGNNYTNRVKSAREAVARALHYSDYFGRAVSNLHSRFTNSSLPRWLPRMLLNSMHVLSTNTLYARDGRFAMIETPATPLLSTADRRLYSSIGTLLFYPELELKECTSLVEAQKPQKSDRLTRFLGFKGFGSIKGEGPQPQADVGASLILMAYRNHMMTNHTVTIRQLYPRLVEIAQYMAETYTNVDGLIQHDKGCSTFEDIGIEGSDSYSNGLWIAALRALMHLANDQRDKDVSAWCTNAIRTAINGFEKEFWNEDPPFYRFAMGETAHQGCLAAQLAGVAFTDLLFLGEMCQNDRVVQAIATIRKHNGKQNGMSRTSLPEGGSWRVPEGWNTPNAATAWPTIMQGAYSALQITRGRPDHGLYDCKTMHEEVLVNGERMFNQPLQWHIEGRKGIGFGNDRHMTSMSVWYVYFALLGFMLDASKNTLWLTPNLPKNVNELNVPLMTPHCIGQLVYGVRNESPYAQQVKVEFDSPVSVSRIVLQVPDSLTSFSVSVTNDGEAINVDHFLGGDGRRTLVEIAPKAPLTVQEPLEIWIRA